MLTHRNLLSMAQNFFLDEFGRCRSKLRMAPVDDLSSHRPRSGEGGVGVFPSHGSRDRLLVAARIVRSFRAVIRIRQSRTGRTRSIPYCYH